MRLALVLALCAVVALFYVNLYLYEKSDHLRSENRMLRNHCDTLLNLSIASEHINCHLVDQPEAQQMLYAKRILGGVVINSTEEASDA